MGIMGSTGAKAIWNRVEPLTFLSLQATLQFSGRLVGTTSKWLLQAVEPSTHTHTRGRRDGEYKGTEKKMASGEKCR